MGLDIVEMVMCVEEEFSIKIPNETAATLFTPVLLCEAVAKLREENGLPVNLSAMQANVCTIITGHFGVPEHLYSINGRFVEDFGLN